MTVSLRPNPISDENACFGVILKCEKAGFFGYRLAQQDEAVISRITNFFPMVGKSINTAFVRMQDKAIGA